MKETTPARETAAPGIDATDRRIIVATQGGLPLHPRPFDELAERLGLAAEDILRRMQRMLEEGVIRRIAAVPDHYALGYGANGMSVWDVPDESVARLGREVGKLDFVSHCYRRPRHTPRWPYNLFAMLHGRSRPEVEAHVRQIAELLADAARSHAVLYSKRILKKSGLRLTA
jgi:DNA-binding Lrp family transcriptional regulator